MWNSTRVLAFIWIFFLMLLQNALHFIFPNEIFPFLLAGVIFYAFSEGPLFGFWLGCYAGFFLDLLGVGRIGPQLFLHGLVGMAAGWSSATLFRDSLWTQIFFPFISSAALLALNRLIYQDRLWESGEALAFFTTAVEWRSLLLTVFLSPIVFRFLRSVSLASRERSLRWR